jgi:Ca2+-binding RTX toxin-like protein
MYTASQLGIKEITNLYLYGSITKPADITSTAPIRPATMRIPVDMDAVSFMATGAGRFANASTIPVVRAFMNGGVFTANGQRQMFGLASAVAIMGTESAKTAIAQSSYQDGTDDHAFRTYVYQSSGFTLAQGAAFVIEADGTRHIQDLAILPFEDNFDFESNAPLSMFGNGYLKPRIDPTGIGRRVDIIFNAASKTQVPRIDYTSSTYAADGIRQQQSFTPITGTAKLSTEIPQVIADLWTQGITQIIDQQGRLILHGSNGADSLSPAKLDNVMLYAPLRAALNQNGIALIGGGGTDNLSGLLRDDYLDGGADNDNLQGGAGNDTYIYKTGDGKDTITDSDGTGSIIVNGTALTGAAKTDYKLQGSNAVWTVSGGQTVYTLNEQQKMLVITGSSLGAGSQITINDFDIKKSGGYLGITLNRDVKTAVTEAGQTNPLAVAGANASAISKTIGEKAAAAFKWFGNVVASAGDSITVAVRSGDGSTVSVVTGADTLDLSSAQTISLCEGQFERGFAIVSDSAITSDQTLELVVTYTHEGVAVESNVLTLTLKDAGTADTTYNGDYLVKTDTYSGAGLTRTDSTGAIVAVVSTGQQNYSWDSQGNLVADASGTLVIDNTIYASAGKDSINGLTGNDLLMGGAGQDSIDGGEGNDMIGGGAGADTIKGGAGDDWISSSGDIASGRQQLGPSDIWNQWALPAGKSAIAQGAMWGTYIEGTTADDKVTIWSGIGVTNTNTAATEGDVIDAGAGDDWVIGSWADDRIQGGDGKDQLDGLAGNDIIEGGAGDDTINADGIVKEGYLNTVAASSHGNDFADGGEGDDRAGTNQISGQGGNDALLGGAMADQIDGGAGDDLISGAGGADTIKGRAGRDVIYGSANMTVGEHTDTRQNWVNGRAHPQTKSERRLYKKSSCSRIILKGYRVKNRKKLSLHMQVQVMSYLKATDSNQRLLNSVWLTRNSLFCAARGQYSFAWSVVVL